MPWFFKGIDEGSRLVVETHMDDFHGCGRRSECGIFLDTVAEKLDLKKSEPFTVGRYSHLKRNRVKLEHGTFIQPDPTHLTSVAETLGVSTGTPPTTPYLDAERPSEDPPVPQDDAKIYGSCVGVLIYVAPDRMDMQRTIGQLSTKLKQPTQYDMKMLRKCAKYGGATAMKGVWLPRPKGDLRGTVRLTNFVDSDHAACKETRRSVSCGTIVADGCPLAGFARRQNIISLSSGESEFCAMHSVHVESLGIKRLLEWLGWRVEWVTRSDSSAARGMALRQGVGRLRHMDSRLLFTQELVRVLGLRIQQVRGTENPADLGTKKHSTAKFKELCIMCGIVDESDLTGDAPDVEIAAVTGDDTINELASHVVAVIRSIATLVGACK